MPTPTEIKMPMADFQGRMNSITGGKYYLVENERPKNLWAVRATWLFIGIFTASITIFLCALKWGVA